jgi:uncharacterized protein (TIGR02594 family)
MQAQIGTNLGRVNYSWKMSRRSISRSIFLGTAGMLIPSCIPKLNLNPLFAGENDLYLPTDFSPFPWMEYALREYGIRGISSRGRTVNVAAYLKATGVGRSSDETAWCSAFVNWCMLMAGFPGSGQANARSWLNWGGVSLDFPVYGSVIVLWRENRNGPLGHVGLFVKMQGDNLLLLGGNQGNAVSIRPYSKERVIGIRWLQGFPIPEGVPD